MGKFGKIVFIVASMMLFFVLAPASSGAQDASGIQIMSGSPGDTLTLQGTGNPCSEACVGVSTATEVVTQGCSCDPATGASRSFSVGMDNIRVDKAKNSFTITVSPVSSASITVVAYNLGGISVTRNVPVTGGKAAISYNNVPTGRYKVALSGYTTADKVSVSVNAGGNVKTDKDGKWSYCLVTSGMPAGKYTVSQNGGTVGMIYLGVPTGQEAAEVTCTPTPEPAVACAQTNVGVAPQCLKDEGITLASVDQITIPGDENNTVDEAAAAVNVTEEQTGAEGQEQDASMADFAGGAAGAIAVVLCACAGIGIGAYLLLFRRK